MGATLCQTLTLLLLSQIDPLNHERTLSDQLQEPARLAVTDSKVVVADARQRSIVRFDLAGALLGTTALSEAPVGVAVHPDGRIFVAYRDEPRVAVYTGDLVFLEFLDPAPLAFVRPTDLATDPTTGRVYVVDAGADRFLAFEADGTLALAVGTRGDGAAEFMSPNAIAVDGLRNRVLVADQDNFRIQVFNTSGVYLMRFGYRNKYLPGGGEEGWLPRPSGLAVASDGNIYVTDALMGTVRVFDPSGGELGLVVGYGSGPGELRVPSDVALDATGRVYVANSQAGTVEVYSALAPLIAHPRMRTRDVQWKADRWRPLTDVWAWTALDLALLSIPGWDPPHMLDDSICGRCHGIEGTPGGHVGLTDGQANLCFSCHRGAGTAPNTLVWPTASLGMSHAWGVPAANELFGSSGPTPTGPLAAHLDGDDLKCGTCHNPHNNDAGSPFLRAPARVICRDCHSDHVIHTPAGAWQPSCEECHAAHDAEGRNLSLVGPLVHNRTLAEDRAVVLAARTGTSSFADGDSTYNGICEVCHTATTYHRQDGSGTAHHNGQDCITCHPHESGFMPTGGGCMDCHAVAQDNGDGVPPGGRRAVTGEFPEADAHAHYGAELSDDACTVCHGLGTHMDGYVELVDPDAGIIYRFIQAADLSSDPDVSDFCAACHDEDGAARLASPLDPFGNGNLPSNVAVKFGGTLQWEEQYGRVCFGPEGTLRPVNSHHDISDADQAFSGAKIECLHCHGAHTSSAAQPVVDPFNPTAPWTADGDSFCLACHAGGAGPLDPGFPTGVAGPVIDPTDPRWADMLLDWSTILGGACLTQPCSALRGIDSCDYGEGPWYVDFRWTHTAHGPISKRGWNSYSGAPEAHLACAVCHEPHGSSTVANPAGNPYLIRDFVDGTAYVDDGSRPGGFNGPPWDTFGSAQEVVVPVSGLDVGWGAPDGLCETCHAEWLSAQAFYHDLCTGCQVCHAHGALWGEADWAGHDDDMPCPDKLRGGDRGEHTLDRLDVGLRIHLLSDKSVAPPVSPAARSPGEISR